MRIDLTSYWPTYTVNNGSEVTYSKLDGQNTSVLAGLFFWSFFIIEREVILKDSISYLFLNYD